MALDLRLRGNFEKGLGRFEMAVLEEKCWAVVGVTPENMTAVAAVVVVIRRSSCNIVFHGSGFKDS